LIIAIPRGQSSDCVAINLELTKQAMLKQGDTAYVGAIDALFSRDLQLTPCMDAYKLEEENQMPKSERILRLGYARDRVIVANKIKKALLNQGKVGATAEFLMKQATNMQYLFKWFQQFEAALKAQVDVAKPSQAITTKRLQWKAQADGEVDPDAMFNQVTLVQATPLHGMSRLLCEALAADPLMSEPDTFAYAKNEIAQQASRDLDIGTETFVSFTFPPEEHSLMVAAAGVGGGIAKTVGSYAYPAHVTFHSSTGEATVLATVAGAYQGPNSLFTGDATALMVTIHALADQANRDFTLLEHS